MEFKAVKPGELFLLIGISLGVFLIALFLLSFFFKDLFTPLFIIWILAMILDSAAYSYFRKSLFLWPIHTLRRYGNLGHISKPIAKSRIEAEKADEKEEEGLSEGGPIKPADEVKDEKEDRDTSESKDESESDSVDLGKDESSTEEKKEENEDDSDDEESEDTEDEAERYVINKSNHKSAPIHDEVDSSEDNYSLQADTDSKED